MLLAKRADTKKFLPGVYELPGGHIDFGENPILGLRREINEELHVQIELGDPFFVFEYTNEIKGSQSFEIIYFAQLTSKLDDITINPEDHSAFGWFAKDELHLVASEDKGLDDIEIIAMQKGFALLGGEQLKFN